MARQETVTYTFTDDLNGGTADETVSFGLDGRAFEIDLSTRNAKALRDALAPYVAAGRALRGRRNARRSGRSRGSSQTAEIRAWAKKKGHQVSERGRVSADLVAKWEASQR